MRDGLPETNTKPSSNQEAQRVPPFLKWAGGKRLLAPRLAPSLKHLNGASYSDLAFEIFRLYVDDIAENELRGHWAAKR